MTKTPARNLALFAVLLCPVPAAQAQDSAKAPVKMEGRCERLVVGGLDITQNCKEKMSRSLAGGRVSYDFSAWDGQSLSFSGEAATAESSGAAPQPITLVVPGQRTKEGVARSPAPATGTCRFSEPAPGKREIACEASAQGRSYAATFIAEVPPDEAAPKP